MKNAAGGGARWQTAKVLTVSQRPHPCQLHQAARVTVRKFRVVLDQKLKEKEDDDAARVDAEIGKLEPESLIG